MKTLFLIDGSAIVFRSYFAFIKQHLRTSKGENTSAVFGYTRFIMKILKEFNPDYMAVCFDTGKPTFRHIKYPKYKATREKAPDELKAQIPKILKITEAFSIPVLEIEGYEADDVIGTIATQISKENIEVFLVTSDKDFLQLVSENIKVINPRKTGDDIYIYDIEKVKERFQVPPEKVCDLLGLAGDSIDNIPGVPSIGPKTASDLIKQFGSVEKTIANLQKITRKTVREKLSKFSEIALLSKGLATIKRDVPLSISLTDFRRKPMNTANLITLFKDLEFFSLIDEIPKETEKQIKYEILKDKNEIAKEGSFGFILKDQEVVISLPKGGVYVGEVDGVKELFSDKTIEKVSTDLKSDLTALSNENITLNGRLFDVSVASYLLHPSIKSHSLDRSALEYQNRRLGDNLYENAKCLIELKEILEKELKKIDLLNLYYELELPLTLVLADMERTGVMIDAYHFKNMSEDLHNRLKKLEDKLYEIAGGGFNLNSPKQLRTILFERLELPPFKKTKTGYSTDVEVLQKLSEIHPFPKLLLEYRELFKLKSTYVDVIPKLANSNKRVHTSFNQTGTATGRLSSSNPNLQNIPMRSEIGRKIRKGFIAPSGYKIVSFDYSQIELRILAHLCGDENLINAFKVGEDIHKKTGAGIFNVKEDEVTGELRRKAKVVNFGITYGMSPYGLSKELDITTEEAAVFINEYFLTYPKVREWINKTIEGAREKGYVKTMLNRIRFLPEINSSNRQRREFAERQAVNTPIQGTAADLIKLAMVNIFNKLKGTQTKLIIQVHDELIFEVSESELSQVKELIKREMEQPLALKVPIVVDIGVGRNWYEAH